MRSYLSQEDLAIWLMTMLIHRKSACAYNVGSVVGFTINQLAHIDFLVPNKQVNILGSQTKSVSSYYLPNIEKADRLIRLQVMTALENAILETAKRHQLTT